MSNETEHGLVEFPDFVSTRPLFYNISHHHDKIPVRNNLREVLFIMIQEFQSGLIAWSLTHDRGRKI